MSSPPKTTQEKDDGASECQPSAVPLFQTSRTGFNDRAWNDPPVGLMNPNSTPNASETQLSGGGRPKLTGRIAFPLDSSKLAEQNKAQHPPIVFNAAGPPPTSGFVRQPPSQ